MALTTFPGYTPAAGKGIRFDHMTTLLAALNATGAWTAVAYAAGNFTGNASMTWTVDSGDQITFAYRRWEKTIGIMFVLTTTSVGGTPNTDLRITLPLGLTAAARAQGWLYYLDNGTHGSGLATVVAAGTQILLAKSGFGNWTASANLTSVYGYIELETTT